jgi:large repetitive protein
MANRRPALIAALLLCALCVFSAEAAIVSGTVTAPGGVRLQGKVVEAYDLTGVLRGTASTDAAGSYQLSLAAGSYRLLAYDPLGTYATQFHPNAEAFELSTPVELRDGTPRQVDFTLPPGVTITGSVTAGSAPLVNAVVEVYNLSGTRRGFTRTNAAGEFSLVVPMGDYKLFAYDANGVYAGEFYANGRTFEEAQTLRVTNPRTVAFALDRAARAGGRVSDAATGAGLPGIFVYAYTADGQFVARTTTDALGQFRFSLQGGSYRFLAGDPARVYAPAFFANARSFARAETLTVTAGVERNDVNLAAERAAIVNGRVTSNSGMVVAYNLDGTPHAQADVSATGEYSLVVAPGQYKISAVPAAEFATQFFRATPDFNAAQVVAVLGGQTLNGIDFDPPRAGTITGAVTDAQSQQPLGGMTVAAYDANGVRVAETTTAANGIYTLRLAPGQYDVVAFDAGLTYAASYAPARVTATVNDTTQLFFSMRRGMRVSGTVASASGAPLEGVEIIARDLSGNPAGGATTAGNGTFTVTVAPGVYTFEARTRFTSTTLGPLEIGNVSPGSLAFVLEGVGRRRAARH